MNLVHRNNYLGPDKIIKLSSYGKRMRELNTNSEISCSKKEEAQDVGENCAVRSFVVYSAALRYLDALGG